MKKLAAFLTIPLLTMVLIFNSCIPEVEVPKEKTHDSRPTGKELSLYYNLVRNGIKVVGGNAFLTEYELTNNSKKTLGNNWAIYFHQPRLVRPESVKGPITLTHINGDYFKIEPNKDFTDLKPDSTLLFSFENAHWSIKYSDFAEGFYVVFSDSTGEISEPEVLTDVTYSDFDRPEQTMRTEKDKVEVPTAASIYAENLKIATDAAVLPIVPSPVSYKAGSGEFSLEAGAEIAFSEDLTNEANLLQAAFKNDLGVDLKLAAGKDAGAIVLKIGSVSIEGAEAYSLNITDKGVEITGSDAAGVFYGVQSLRSLVSSKAYNQKGSAKLGFASVVDGPRFAYRGMHLDVARNFQKIESVKRLLDGMAFYKLNKFHFHLTDDEAWRIEIPGLPELIEIGSKKKHNPGEKEALNPSYGSGPFETYPGSGHYTKAEFVEILKYAKARHIEVIPEIDMPGHARAAVISMKARYDKYLKDGNKEAATEYLLSDLEDKSEYISVQFYKDNISCVCQESTYKFLEKVVDEMMAMYKEAGLELKMVHTGGDEVPQPTQDDPESGAWAKSPACQKLLAENADYHSATELFYYFVERFSGILKERGITAAGWEEIGMRKGKTEDEEGEEPNAEFIEKGLVPYAWNSVWGWGSEDRAYKMANAGYNVVMSNVTNLYFDLAYNKHPQERGYYWGGLTDTKTPWEFTPFDIVKCASTDLLGYPIDALDMMSEKEELTPIGKKNILGIQGQLWSETVRSEDHMEYMIFPKLLGLAERAWAPTPEWATIDDPEVRATEKEKAWSSFATTVGVEELPTLDVLIKDINYRIPAPGGIIEEGMLKANVLYAGLKIEYSVKEGEWSEYTEPVAVTGTVKIRAVNASGRSSMVMVVAAQ